ncbi:MAG: molybdopterin-dependent oxidoreductase [Solirubrobacteraceae bacterium]|nr:molybdopterin-dependent oxidoreductase [Solirubrobacteraceae bacterium]
MVEEKPTFCRICEPLCGMIATVEDGQLTQLRPDKDHPLSKGFACPKGIAFAEVHNDPDRVRHPLKKTADGRFEQVSWDDAMSDIIGRLRKVHDDYGAHGVGWYFGNPGAFSYSHSLTVPVFMRSLGSPHLFTAGSQDVNNRFVASELLYGNPTTSPVPDLTRTQFAVIMGANPLVSHGSVLTAPRIKEELHGIVERGGRVLVIDPRRTETAKAFEWLPVQPDGDAFMLLSLLHVLFEEGLADERALHDQARGADELRALAQPFTPESTEAQSGVSPHDLRALARDLATTERAAIYGRVGTSVGRAGTLTTMLMDAVNLVAGNLDREGGSMFGTFGIPFERLGMQLLAKGSMSQGSRRTRIGDFPMVLGSEPATMMAKEILTPGKGQIRALFVSAGNPVLSCPNGDELEGALEELDLMVGIDLYVNETNAHADYILPATTMYEREDFPIPFQSLHLTPFRQATEAVVAPAGEARQEYEIVDELMRGMWRRSPALTARELTRRALQPLGINPFDPRRIIDSVIRVSEGGDLFGLRRGGLSLKKLLRDHPHGKVIAPHLRAGVLRDIVLFGDRKVHLDAPELAEEVRRIQAKPADPAFPLRLIGMRELRSENSWMHNSPLLGRGGRTHTARLHPADAAAIGVEAGDRIRLVSPHGEIEIAVSITEDLKEGVVAVPHGWGHKGRGNWQRSNKLGGDGGVNVNLLMSTDPADVEPLAGMAHLTGVPVRAEALTAPADAAEQVTVGAA